MFGPFRLGKRALLARQALKSAPLCSSIHRFSNFEGLFLLTLSEDPPPQSPQASVALASVSSVAETSNKMVQLFLLCPLFAMCVSVFASFLLLIRRSNPAVPDSHQGTSLFSNLIQLQPHRPLPQDLHLPQLEDLSVLIGIYPQHPSINSTLPRPQPNWRGRTGRRRRPFKATGTLL